MQIHQRVTLRTNNIDENEISLDLQKDASSKSLRSRGGETKG